MSPARAARDDVPVVVAARRTWIGTAGHGHRSLSEVDLAAGALGAALADARSLGVEDAVADVVLGCCAGPGGNVARVAALAAGLDVSVPGLTVDRQCASGLAAVLLAAQQVRAGEARLVLAGGTESASSAPTRAHRTTWGDVPYARAAFAPTPWADPGMGAAADELARRRGVTRERQEAYALRSHARALAAHAGGRFAAETVRVGAPGTTLARDERARRLDPAVLPRLSPAFTPRGTVTAATASPVSDGAAAVVVVPEAVRRDVGVPGLRVLASATVGCDPALPGWGPVPAVRAALDRAGARLDDVTAVEVVEAFAAQVLAVTDALGLDPLDDPGDDARVCADGGALALGHPWGASGAVSVVRLFSRLVRAGAPAGTLGLATAAVGGGLGVAAVLEVVR
ncbi:thiolase family protein [Cellulosimicrobium protaetiae]|uniref:Probable acetyl-CoA acetyltransferase n=1 Tax=Cellulosimicrobium protaetiae TaxID=2587808 RepID=A0A6M5UKI8_9MICO|nr:thiolase family protein [Cellulosimicrobium protaetiae]QJW37209.1 thiolase family protein [Cellulosimicrobium protaetiae]